MCGGDEHPSDSEIVIVHPSHLVDRDPTILPLADLPRGFCATRTSAGSIWVRAESEPDEDDESGEISAEDQLPILLARVADRPNDPAAWFDLGLTYKRLRKWKPSIDANLRAIEISSAVEDPAWWNLGIAATAIRDWDLARRAWQGYGLEIDGGTGEVRCNYGSAPVRLPAPNAEVVWGDRLDPARVIIRSIPLPSSGYRWGDIVLHDGVPNGERDIAGIVYPVFDVLERWSPSEIPTLSVHARCSSDEDARALVELFEAKQFGAEDWTTNVRQLCKSCSEGLPSGHDHPILRGTFNREFGLASPMGLAKDLLSEWQHESPKTRAYDPPTFA